MKTQTSIARTTCTKTMATPLRAAWLLLLLLLLTLPTVVQAQFNYTTNNGTITITGYTGRGGAVTIPSMTDGLLVTSIGGDAFSFCTSLSSITIPDCVTSIGQEAFYGCTVLQSVIIGNGVTNIGQYSFWDCLSLTSVTIPDSVINLGQYAFIDCHSLSNVTIGNSLTNIGQYAFQNNTHLMGVYFKGNAPSTAQTAFLNDKKLTVYYLPGTTNWGPTFGGRPTMLWKPQMQTSNSSFGVQTNGFGFNINWASGMTVVVEVCTNLINPLWSPLAMNTLTNGSSYFNDPQWTNYPARFYRLRSP